MADSQRRQGSAAPVLKTDGQSKKDNLMLVGFFFGGIGLVSGMLWLANGLSDNFKVTSTSFFVFVVGMAIATAAVLVNKFVIKD